MEVPPAGGDLDGNMREPIGDHMPEPIGNLSIHEGSTLFTRNLGQVADPDIEFYSGDGSIWFTADGAWFDIRDPALAVEETSFFHGRNGEPLGSGPAPGPADQATVISEPAERYGIAIKQVFLGSRGTTPVGMGRTSWNSNFFYGNEPSGWMTDVPNFQEVWYPDLYDGIDLRYYLMDGALKYDLMVRPGGDPSSIRMEYQGGSGVAVGATKLAVETSLGELTDKDLFIYQKQDGIDPVAGRFKDNGDGTIGFDVMGAYDPGRDLIIDPAIEPGVQYSTLVGGGNVDYAMDVAVDHEGYAYVAGLSFSNNFPATPGAYSTSRSGGSDVVVYKVERDGKDLVYATFIGGANYDEAYGIAIDDFGNAYITGHTNSSDLPVTSGSFSTSLSGDDAFLVKLDPAGSALLYSTYIGGSDAEEGARVGVDPSGNAIIIGTTNSSDFPVTPGAFDTTYNDLSGFDDGFIFKLNPDGSSSIFSTYLGSTGADHLGDLALDPEGPVYVVGTVADTGFPITPNAYDDVRGLGYEVVVAKLSADGSGIQYSTYVGRDAWDRGYGIAIHPGGDVVVVGLTHSFDFPVTSGAYDTSHGVGTNPDGFLVRLDGTLSTLVYGTYLGDSGYDSCSAVVVDVQGNPIVTGYTESTNFPTTSGAYRTSFGGDPGDSFVSKLSDSGSSLLYSTYLGSGSYDSGMGISMEPTGNLAVVGMTSSENFPTTQGAFDKILNGAYDSFVTSFHFPPVKVEPVDITLDGVPSPQLYARYRPYNFSVDVIDIVSQEDLTNVTLTLDPEGIGVELMWDRQTDGFSELYDPDDLVTLDTGSTAIYDDIATWTVKFRLMPNWNYPDEESHPVVATAYSSLVGDVIQKELPSTYHVENDLIFTGLLLTEGEDGRYLGDMALVRGGERLTWTGMTPAYEGTADVYPPQEEFDVTVWEQRGECWTCSPGSGEQFVCNTTVPSDMGGQNTHTVNISGIPPECDLTDVSLTLKIDRLNVTFSDPTPHDTHWQDSAEVNVGVTITDGGASGVNGSGIMTSVSTDDGTTWTDWAGAPQQSSEADVRASDRVALEEGTANLVRWSALDNVGNGPAVSPDYRVLVDITGPVFSDPYPGEAEVIKTSEVSFGINVTDALSGIDASSVKYSISKDGGSSWTVWTSPGAYEDGGHLAVSASETFPNGTDHRIRWLAYDVAGNGPGISPEFPLHVDLSVPPPEPKVVLTAPADGSEVESDIVQLMWMQMTPGLKFVSYDVLLDTVYPPVDEAARGLSTQIMSVTELEDETTYFWTVVPITADGKRWEGKAPVWSFHVNIQDITSDYGVELSYKDHVRVKAGESAQTYVTLVNDGSASDTFSLSYGSDGLQGDMVFQEDEIGPLRHGGSELITLVITPERGTPAGEYPVTITARSQGAFQAGVVVEGNVTFNVTVVQGKEGDTGSGGPEKGGAATTISILVAVVVMVIVLAGVAVIAMKRGKAGATPDGGGVDGTTAPAMAGQAPGPQTPAPAPAPIPQAPLVPDVIPTAGGPVAGLPPVQEGMTTQAPPMVGGFETQPALVSAEAPGVLPQESLLPPATVPGPSSEGGGPVFGQAIELAEDPLLPSPEDE